CFVQEEAFMCDLSAVVQGENAGHRAIVGCAVSQYHCNHGARILFDLVQLGETGGLAVDVTAVHRSDWHQVVHERRHVEPHGTTTRLCDEPAEGEHAVSAAQQQGELLGDMHLLAG